ncbi:MAG: hypothetical protein ACQ9MH_18525 [Nitrospinales bacterium]
MKEKKVSRKEQLCISECIHKYWRHPDVSTEDDRRNQNYEQCLTSCNICG